MRRKWWTCVSNVCCSSICFDVWINTISQILSLPAVLDCWAERSAGIATTKCIKHTFTNIHRHTRRIWELKTDWSVATTMMMMTMMCTCVARVRNSLCSTTNAVCFWNSFDFIKNYTENYNHQHPPAIIHFALFVCTVCARVSTRRACAFSFFLIFFIAKFI